MSPVSDPQSKINSGIHQTRHDFSISCLLCHLNIKVTICQYALSNVVNLFENTKNVEYFCDHGYYSAVGMIFKMHVTSFKPTHHELNTKVEKALFIVILNGEMRNKNYACK